MDKNLQNLKFDVRTQEWSLKTGLLKEDELKKHLQNLEDVSKNAVPLQVTEESRH
jgi:hypothetical protein